MPSAFYVITMVRYRDHDHVHQMVHGMTVRSHARVSVISIAHSIRLLQSTQLDQSYLSVVRARLYALPFDRDREHVHLFGTRKSFSTLRPRTKEIEPDEE